MQLCSWLLPFLFLLLALAPADVPIAPEAAPENVKDRKEHDKAVDHGVRPMHRVRVKRRGERPCRDQHLDADHDEQAVFVVRQLDEFSCHIPNPHIFSLLYCFELNKKIYCYKNLIIII